MISHILSMEANGGIGWSGNIPWQTKALAKRFAAITTGKPVVMGRRTHEQIVNVLLPDRANFVVSKKKGYESPYGAVVVNSLTGILDLLQSYCEEVMVIGGGEIFDETFSVCGRIYLTKMQQPCRCDTFYASGFCLTDWRIESVEKSEDSTFYILERKVK